MEHLLPTQLFLSYDSCSQQCSLTITLCQCLCKEGVGEGFCRQERDSRKGSVDFGPLEGHLPAKSSTLICRLSPAVCLGWGGDALQKWADNKFNPTCFSSTLRVLKVT